MHVQLLVPFAQKLADSLVRRFPRVSEVELLVRARDQALALVRHGDPCLVVTRRQDGGRLVAKVPRKDHVCAHHWVSDRVARLIVCLEKE